MAGSDEKGLTAERTRRTIIIGGGASGFFCAINIKSADPQHEVIILEKSQKILSKVRISGGGRCNVTHDCPDIGKLVLNYPRGSRELRQVFSRFTVSDTVDWFQERGITLKTESDGRMFPVSDSSETIISCFTDECARLKIPVRKGCEVFAIDKTDSGFTLRTNVGSMSAYTVVCASGGHPKPGSYDLARRLGHSIDTPLPSLFTFNLPKESISRELQGIAVPQCNVSVDGTKLRYDGPVLVTHWGLSGPAVLKLSAFAAEHFAATGYSSTIHLSWVHPSSPGEVSEKLQSLKNQIPKQKIVSYSWPGLPRRLWEFLCGRAGIRQEQTWGDAGRSLLESLKGQLTDSQFFMQGKTTFKEEFVTCGGVNLKEIDFRRMESRIVPGLYFCGEVLNIDGITGGFNFQAAWSTAWVAAAAITGSGR